MDDLLGEDWQAPPKTTPSNVPKNPTPFASNPSSYRASPAPTGQGLATPQSITRPASAVNQRSGTPAGDQFGNLLSLKSQKQANNLSIREQQQHLADEKRRQQEQQAQLWETLGSGRGTPAGNSPAFSAIPSIGLRRDDTDYLLAAFDKNAPVDKSSHLPPPVADSEVQKSSRQSNGPTPVASNGFHAEDDDDPFELNSLTAKRKFDVKREQYYESEDIDILGDLGRPVSAKPAEQLEDKRAPREASPLQTPQTPHDDDSPRDRRVAELVEMGFPADAAKIALLESGGNVQGAVGWLLQQAHEESRQKARGEATSRQRSPPRRVRSPLDRTEGGRDSTPHWIQNDSRSSSATGRQDRESRANGDKDAAQVAQELGSKFLKGANSLWKASQKQMVKTMAEFQQERDPVQPKWMQDPGRDTTSSSWNRQRDEYPARRTADVTNEAAMLDAPRERPHKSSGATQTEDIPIRPRMSPQDPSSRPAQQPSSRQPTSVSQDKRPAAKLSRQEVEAQTSQAYVSPARRKRPIPHPPPEVVPEVDLFSSTAPAPKPAAASTTPAPPRTGSNRNAPAAPAPPRPKAPPREIPQTSPSALSTSAAHRKRGGEAFKRGDYASAHEAYSSALRPIPPTHPVAIIILSNRSLTALKTGDAKLAVADADQALTIIGASQGVGETIDLESNSGEAPKEMREFYGKALMRKAEALEHLEKWSEAAAVWRTAVEAGVGGAVGLRGKDRCEKAAAPKPAAPVRRAGEPSPALGPKRATTLPQKRAPVSNAASAEAVAKLRAANQAAEKADDEKFALTDSVDTKLNAWKGGKADNLRALLQSLDGVLWAEAGWKKVGMSDLVMPTKVKIVYMKAIAKVHPDKIPQDASTEQRMISAAVFSILNEAWDKFKKDNNL